MKKILFILSLLFCVSALSAQKIKTKEVDKFTKSKIITTSWDRWFRKTHSVSLTYNMGVRCCLKAIDDELFLNAEIYVPVMYYFDEDSGLVLLLDNDETITLNVPEGGIAEKGGGDLSGIDGYCFKTVFDLTPELLHVLREHKVLSVRIIAKDKHFDADLKAKSQDYLIRLIKLVEEAK